MEYYKHSETGDVYAYENDQQRRDYGPKELVPMTFEDVERHTTPTLEEVKAAKIESLSLQCQQAIYDGFESDALGATHLYPANDKDQINLLASVTDAMRHPDEPEWRTIFWCADKSGEWAMRPHTADQIQAVGDAGKKNVTSMIIQNEELAQQVRSAKTPEEVEKIQWSL